MIILSHLISGLEESLKQSLPGSFNSIVTKHKINNQPTRLAAKSLTNHSRKPFLQKQSSTLPALFVDRRCICSFVAFFIPLIPFFFNLKRMWIAKDGLLKKIQGPVISKDKIVAIKKWAPIFCCFCAAAQIKLFTQFVHKDKEMKTRRNKGADGVESRVQRGCVEIKEEKLILVWDLYSITHHKN